eukprot:7107361-Prymnesium_polylepis.1
MARLTSSPRQTPCSLHPGPRPGRVQSVRRPHSGHRTRVNQAMDMRSRHVTARSKNGCSWSPLHVGSHPEALGASVWEEI